MANAIPFRAMREKRYIDSMIAATVQLAHRSRRLRRYERRWIVERFFAWIQWQRRPLVRWEYNPLNFLGFVQLAALCILLKQF